MVKTRNQSKRTLASISPRKIRIMVVDDEDILPILKRTLELNNFQVDTFPNAKEALSKFQPLYYDLLILDI